MIGAAPRPQLPAEHAFVVPAQQVGFGLEVHAWRNGDLCPMQWVIGSPVLELSAKAIADLQSQFGRDCHVTKVEKAMKVRPYEKAVADLVFTTTRVRFDVSGFKDRK